MDMVMVVVVLLVEMEVLEIKVEVEDQGTQTDPLQSLILNWVVVPKLMLP